MKCSLVLVLACVAGVNAFLPAAAPRMAVQRSMTMLQKPASLQVAKSSMMALKQSESATIVAAETKTSLLDKVWNKNTKLTIYLAIWYLGNIYCTSSFFLHDAILCFTDGRPPANIFSPNKLLLTLPPHLL